MDNLAGARYFSSLDLTAGYHQLRLQPSDIPKTAFNTHMGKFEYKVLPMGLTNAPSVFQTVIGDVSEPRLGTSARTQQHLHPRPGDNTLTLTI